MYTPRYYDSLATTWSTFLKYFIQGSLPCLISKISKYFNILNYLDDLLTSTSFYVISHNKSRDHISVYIVNLSISISISNYS